MIFAYLLTLLSILDASEKEKVAMQFNLLKGPWVQQNHLNNDGSDFKKKKRKKLITYLNKTQVLLFYS